jgi:hypothetical protein
MREREREERKKREKRESHDDTTAPRAPAHRRTEPMITEPIWRVRITLRGGMIHVARRTRPVVHLRAGRAVDVEMEVISGTELGDEIGFIDWSEVTAVTRRQITPKAEKPAAPAAASAHRRTEPMT